MGDQHCGVGRSDRVRQFRVGSHTASDQFVLTEVTIDKSFVDIAD